MKIEANDFIKHLDNNWILYASNSVTGNRLYYNGLGFFQVKNKLEILLETGSLPHAVKYFNELESK